ncbi:F-box/kelch-repeat protein At3g06240-like [Rutidosis leptorrhynchoides]|uniref:F-box/kelch-repeat protein At3g06240-like n=1 Tax=Rutidosis leptorrhynchoides TaxID=125765 RepID=UPI003A998908
MASDIVSDEIVLNILAKLPTKSLVRFRCVSRYWRCMLMEPYFIKLRSHKNIILSVNTENLDFINGGNTYSIFKQCYPLDHLRRTTANLIGSFNGLVLMVYAYSFILYNPFTGESKKLPSPPSRIGCYKTGYGFGYGATPNDLKIVKIENYSNAYEVYDFKGNSWSSLSTKKYNVNYIRFVHPMGTFVNGYLYWIESKYVLIVFGVKDMVLSEIVLPASSSNFFLDTLGTINGCLCSLNMTELTTSSRLFELWVSKEHSIESTWVKTHSFTLDFKWDYFYHTINIYDDGKILMVDPSNQFIIYDISKSSYETLEISLSEHFRPLFGLNCVQYVETLVSPSDVYFSRLSGRKRKSTR